MTRDPAISDYFCGVLRVLASAGMGIIGERFVQDLSPNAARMTASVEYEDGSRLAVRLIVNTSSDYPDWNRYSFQYMSEEAETVFRYDDSDHHPELPNFPHHKHEGADERVLGVLRPTVRQVRNEIADYLTRRHLND